MKRQKGLVWALITVMVLGLVVGLVGFGADKSAKEKVYVRATWAVDIVSNGDVWLKFGSQDYKKGYVVRKKATKLRVGAPTSGWSLEASTGFNFGNANLKRLYIGVHGKGWKQLYAGHKSVVLMTKGPIGFSTQSIDYKVETKDLKGEVQADLLITFKVI